jgi:RimJ/RimL family protein N-acetyltransferase
MVIERGFGLGIPEVFALVVPTNLRSLRVCRRLCMKNLGRTTRYHYTEYELFHLPRPRRRANSVARTPQRARS